MSRTHRRFVFVNALVACALLGSVSPRALAAIETRETLKTYFETGDVPTQEQFANMIDSYIHISEDRHLLGLKEYSTGLVYLAGDGDVIGGSSDFGPALGLGSDWAGRSGFIGLSFEENSEVHFGYVHLLTDASSPTMYPVTIDRFVFENSPGAPITVTAVPEPASLALCVSGLLMLGFARLRRRSTAA